MVSMARCVLSMDPLVEVGVEGGEGRTRGPWGGAMGLLKDPHRTAFTEMFLHSIDLAEQLKPLYRQLS